MLRLTHHVHSNAQLYRDRPTRRQRQRLAARLIRERPLPKAGSERGALRKKRDNENEAQQDSCPERHEANWPGARHLSFRTVDSIDSCH